MLIPASTTAICLCWWTAKAMAGMLPISRWKWVAEALLHSLSPVAWKILAFPRRSTGQSVSATNAAELHSAAAICSTWGDPYVNGHVIYWAQTPEAVAPFHAAFHFFAALVSRQIFTPALLFLKRGINRAVVCYWFCRTVQEAFLEFHFLPMTWQHLIHWSGKTKQIRCRCINRAVICYWFGRTVQEAFLEFHFLPMTWQYLIHWSGNR